MLDLHNQGHLIVYSNICWKVKDTYKKRKTYNKDPVINKIWNLEQAFKKALSAKDSADFSYRGSII